MHSKESISETIRNFLVANAFGGKENPDLQNNTSLISSRIIDSIIALKMVTYLENTYKIEFEAHEVTQENLDSIDRITAFVMAKLN